LLEAEEDVATDPDELLALIDQTKEVAKSIVARNQPSKEIVRVQVSSAIWRIID
jgi:hypothetical protein